MMNHQQSPLTRPFSQWLSRLKSGLSRTRRQRKSREHQRAASVDVLESRLLLSAVTIDNASVAEGDAGVSVATFTVTVDTAAGGPFRVTYATGDNTATTINNDYDSAIGTLDFAGDTDGESHTISVNVNGDEVVELAETFTVTLLTVLDNTDVTLGTAVGTGTITNDDAATISIDDVAITEGNSGTPMLDFTVTLDRAVSGGFTVDYASADTTAAAGTDYTNTSGTLTFAGTVGETKTISVPITAETDAEPDETFTMTLSGINAGGRDVTVSKAVGIGTITDDDRIAVNLGASVNAATETAGTVVTLTATAETAVDGDQTFTVQISGTGITSSDYTLSNTTITIQDTQTTGTVTFTVLDDALVEALETVSVTLTSPSSGVRAGTTPSQEIVITDNDTATLTIGDAAVAETDSGTTTLSFTVSSDKAVDTAFSVDFMTVDDSATVANADYVASSATLNFEGDASEEQTISVVINGDTIVELNEAFTVTLSNIVASGRSIVLDNASATGTITNDDAATLSIDNVTLDEGNSGDTTFTFTVTLNNAVDAGFDVTVNTADDTATSADSDYTPITNRTLSFAGTASETQTIDVVVSGDTKVELDEAFQVLLSNLGAGGRDISLPSGPGIATITNDDSGIEVNLSASVNTGTESAETVVTLTATAAAAVTGDQTVHVNVTGIAVTDYLLSGSTISILDGETTGSVTFTVQNDDLVEALETAVVTISSPTAGVFLGATTSQSIAITDDDSATISIDDVTLAEGTAGAAAFVFTVTLSKDVDTELTVDYQTVNGTASSDSDYSAAAGTLTFEVGGPKTQTLTVNVSGDELVEMDENFLVNLTNLSASGRSVTLQDNQGRGVISNDDSATLSIDDITMTEGDTGNSAFTFTVTLDKAVDIPFTVDYSTSDDTTGAHSATAGSDYVAVSGNALSFAGTVGETQTLSILVIGDTVPEADETFLVTLSNILATGRSLSFANAQGTATIADNDGIQVDLSASVNSGTEADETVVTLTATAASPVAGDQSIDLVISGVGITATDYALSTATIVIPDGQTTGTATFTILDDARVELTETATVTLANPSITLALGTTISQDIVITDNDAATLSIDDVTAAETNSGSTIFTFTVTLDNSVDGSVTINYATADGTATATSGDYTASTGSTLTFAGTAGETQTIDITVAGDATVELDETFFVNLTGLVNNGLAVTVSDSEGQGTISNDDTASLTIDDVQVIEGHTGTTAVVFTVTLDNAVDVGFTVDYMTVDGSATVADSDYTAVTTTALSFAGTAGESQTVTIQATGDTNIENDEVFTVELSNIVVAGGRSVILGDGTGRGTIADDDGIPVNLTVTLSAGSEASGTVISLVATADSEVTGDQTVDVVVTGTGITGTDYVLSSNTITIVDGLTTGTVVFTVSDDDIVESLETAIVSITNPSLGIRLGPNTSRTINITSDDIASLSIDDVSLAEGDSGTQVLTFTVSVDKAVDGGFTVDYATEDDSAAVADSDYAAASGTLTFSGAAAETQTISIMVNGDETEENDETFFVNLTNGLPAAFVTITKAQGIGTITDDDSAAPPATVDISLTPLAGKEADQTVMTVTATAATAVSGDQTVDVTVSGTNVTSTDYLLSAATITIPDGQTTASVMLTITADGLLEAALENGTVSLTNPSAGLMLGSTPSANFTIQDYTEPILDDVDRYPGTQPTLTWQPVPGAVRYEMWFSRVFPSGKRVYSDTNVTDTSWTVPAELDSAFYRYWVRAFDAAGNASLWSNARVFEVQPTLTGPLTGAFTNRPTFSWEPIPFAAGYTLYLRTTQGNDIIENITTTSYTPPTDLPAGEVRWWVRASEAIGNRGWSNAALTGIKPYTAVTGPATPTADTTPTFTWRAVQEAGRYVLYVQNLDTSEVVINDATITDTQYTPTTALPSGNYRVWVKAIDGATDEFNSGSWSRRYDMIITATAAAEAAGQETEDDDTQSLLTQIVAPVQTPVRREQPLAEESEPAQQPLVIPASTTQPLPQNSELAVVDALMTDPLLLAAIME